MQRIRDLYGTLYRFSSRSSSPFRERFFLLLLLLEGATLRLWRLGEASLTGDEMAWADLFLSKDILYPALNFGKGQNHAGYTVPTRLLIEVLGRSEFAVRFVPAALGIATLAAMWVLGKALMGRKAGLILVSLFAISYHPVVYSRVGRGYAIAIFFVSLVAYFLYTAWMRGGSWRWFGYAVAVVGAGYSHLYTGLPVAALGAWVVLQWATTPDRSRARERLIQYLIASEQAIIILVILYAPGLSMYVGQVIGQKLPQILDYSLATVLRMMVNMGPVLPQGGNVLLPMLALIGVIAQVRSWRKLSLLLLWFAGPILALWTTRFYAAERFLLPIAPAYLLLVACGIMAVGRAAARWHAQASSTVVVGALAVLLGLGLMGVIPTLDPAVPLYKNQPNNDWRGMAEYLKLNGSQDDVVLSAILGRPEETSAAFHWYHMPERLVHLLHFGGGIEKITTMYDKPRRTWWLMKLPVQIPVGANSASFGTVAVVQFKEDVMSKEEVLAASIQVLENVPPSWQNNPYMRAQTYLVTRLVAEAYLELGKPAEALRVIKATPNRPKNDWQNDILLARARAALGEPCNARFALDYAQGHGAPAEVLEQYSYLTKGCPPRK